MGSRGSEYEISKEDITNNEMLYALSLHGFKRWTKGDKDRLYIEASQLGLDETPVKSSNTFGGYKAPSGYLDVKTGEVHADRDDIKQEIEKIIKDEVKDMKSQVSQAKKSSEKMVQISGEYLQSYFPFGLTGGMEKLTTTIGKIVKITEKEGKPKRYWISLPQINQKTGEKSEYQFVVKEKDIASFLN